jgi:hypothetical protein
VQASGPQEGSKEERHQDRPRSTSKLLPYIDRAKAQRMEDDDGGIDADERSRREVINLQYEDQGMQIPYPEVRIAAAYTKMRPVNSEAMVTPEELVPLGYPQERVDETDQDQQYCCVIDQEAREAYCRSTPKDDGPAPENMDAGANQRRTEKIRRLVKL